MSRLLVFGSGVLGGQVVDLLSMLPSPYTEIVVASRNVERTIRRVNLSRFAGIDVGRDLHLSVRQIDLRNIDATATLISDVDPDVIFQSACIWSWWKIRELPEEIFRDLDRAGVGPWLPLYLALTLNVMKAVKESGLHPQVVNGCYPDANNAALASIDLPPLCGIGNVARSVSILRAAVADHLNLSSTAIDVRLYAEHYVGYQLLQCSSPELLPKVLRVLREGRDITDSLPLDAILRDIPNRYPRVRGMAGQLLTATSAFNILCALRSACRRVEHAPGPLGMIGGYPCEFTEGRVKVLLDGVSNRQAQEVNRQGLALEGIESIEPNGSIRFSDANISILHRVFGYSATRINVSDTWQYATELSDRYTKFAQQFPRRAVA